MIAKSYGNKIASAASRSNPDTASQTEISEGRYISQEKRQENIDKLRLIWNNNGTLENEANQPTKFRSIGLKWIMMHVDYNKTTTLKPSHLCDCGDVCILVNVYITIIGDEADDGQMKEIKM